MASAVKNGLEMSGTINPITRFRPARRLRADAFGTKPISSITFCTLRRVSGANTSGRLIALETVPKETPAALATSLILATKISLELNKIY